MNPPTEGWNYFNYFTEVEEHFQKVRGTSLFLMSPLDWALVETWKDAGIPVEAVLRGIDACFQNWNSRKKRVEYVNSLAYCAQAIYREAKAMERGSSTAGTQGSAAAPFSAEEIRAFLRLNAQALRSKEGFTEIASSLDRLTDEADDLNHLESMEQKLTSLEEKMVAIARTRIPEEELFSVRIELDAMLRPYRGKMSAEQLSMLERQYLDKGLLERSGLPRLSLFYLR